MCAYGLHPCVSTRCTAPHSWTHVHLAMTASGLLVIGVVNVCIWTPPLCLCKVYSAPFVDSCAPGHDHIGHVDHWGSECVNMDSTLVSLQGVLSPILVSCAPFHGSIGPAENWGSACVNMDSTLVSLLGVLSPISGLVCTWP